MFKQIDIASTKHIFAYQIKVRTKPSRNELPDTIAYLTLTLHAYPQDFTHVVSTVTYGMGANFKLTRRFKRDESKQEISGNLHVLVKSIPQFSIEGSAKINISGTLLVSTHSRYLNCT